MRQLLKKEVKWDWTSEIDEDFKKLKKEITEAPCLAHFDPRKDNYITTDACNTGLGATLWQKEGETFRPVAFASRFLTDCEKKYAINELELLGALWGLEYFRYFVYGKRVNLLTDHQALQPLLKKNRAHKQYSARLTRWLDRLSHFDVNVQYTAGKNIPLTDYLSRHPIVSTETAELENNADGLDEAEVEEEFVINQIYGLLEFNQKLGSIKRFTERSETKENFDQSQSDNNTHEQNQNDHLRKASPLPNNIVPNWLITLPSSNNKMDKVNGIDMEFIYKKSGHSPETKRLWIERNHILKPNKTCIVGKGKESERIQEYRPNQAGRKRIAELNIDDQIVIPGNMRSTIIAMLHQGHILTAKMDQLAEAFWWPGIHREIQEKAETCPSCRAAGKNIITQIPSTEKNKLEILTEPNQEIQLDFAGPIKSKTRGNVYILVAVDRFSKWPTAQVCGNTDTRTVLKFLTKYFTDNGTPQCIRTDNGSCFKSNEFKKFCNDENIKRIRCTPNLHIGTGLVERMIRTIKSLTNQSQYGRWIKIRRQCPISNQND